MWLRIVLLDKDRPGCCRSRPEPADRRKNMSQKCFGIYLLVDVIPLGDEGALRAILTFALCRFLDNEGPDADFIIEPCLPAMIPVRMDNGRGEFDLLDKTFALAGLIRLILLQC